MIMALLLLLYQITKDWAGQADAKSYPNQGITFSILA